MPITKKMWLRFFSDNLADYLTERGLSQADLAEKSHLSQASISKYMSMQRIPSCIAIANIARALECDVGDLIDMGTYVEESTI